MYAQTPLSVSKELYEITGKVSCKSKPVFIHITPANHATELNCHNNVNAHIQLFGGSIVYWWCIYVWPRVLVEFEFHSMWKSNNGELHDITQRPDKETDCLFLQDDDLKYSGLRLPNLLFSLSKDKLVIDYINASNEYAAIITENQTPYTGEAKVNIKQLQMVSEKNKSIQTRLQNSCATERNDPCPCGSRKKFKHCHANA